jgi:hypothetical protein
MHAYAAGRSWLAHVAVQSTNQCYTLSWHDQAARLHLNAFVHPVTVIQSDSLEEASWCLNDQLMGSIFACGALLSCRQSGPCQPLCWPCSCGSTMSMLPGVWLELCFHHSSARQVQRASASAVCFPTQRPCRPAWQTLVDAAGCACCSVCQWLHHPLALDGLQQASSMYQPITRLSCCVQVLKHVLNHERPDNAPKADPGMPSSHANSTCSLLRTATLMHCCTT